MNSKITIPKRLWPFQDETNVWVEYMQLLTKYNPVNLGQGFPDYPCPEHITQTLADVITSKDATLNQYTRCLGHPRLVKALSKLYSKEVSREIDPYNEIVVCGGAYEALVAICSAHIDEGDEVIVIEPFFDPYKNLVLMAGGVPRFIPLRPRTDTGDITSADWILDEDELRKTFNNKTKMILLNTPHNPTGKVFTLKELELIALLCQKHDVLCLSDEVYEWLAYKPNKHIRIATLPNMWERTITVGSGGKTFSVTGWKLGWAYGPAELMKNIHIAHQIYGLYGCAPIQEAVARIIEYELSIYNTPQCYFFSLAKELKTKRDRLYKCLKNNGFKPTLPDGGYFLVADWTTLSTELDLTTETDKYKDYKFMKIFTKDVGILTIPVSAFYSEAHKHIGEKYIRVCFVKDDEKLQLTDKLLREWNAENDKK